MPLSGLTIAVVGADYPNKRGPNRRFEIALSAPGDAVNLVAEPKNKHDAQAIQVFSAAGVCMGYVAADRTTIIHHAWRDARDVRAIFQAKADFGAWIRVGFDEPPTLPPPAAPRTESAADPDVGFYPDWVPEDE